MKPTLLLIGERALELRERLEASGYDTVGWSGADAVQSIGAGLIPQDRVKAVLITSDELAVVPLLQKSCGAGDRVPLLVEAMERSHAANREGGAEFEAMKAAVAREMREAEDAHGET